MAKYKIEFKKSVLKEIRRIPNAMLRRIHEAIYELRENPTPHGCTNVRGYEDHYRIRIGQYRVIYRVASKIQIITVIKIGHRGDVYRRM